MDDNNILSVQLDLAKGTCTVSRNDGKEVIVREINDGTINYYSKNVMDERRKAIEKIEGKNGWIASDLLKGIDPVLYDTLEAFDAKYGTEYRHIYANAASMSITYTEVGVPNMSMRNRRIYAKKASEIRTEKLQKAGISIEYDVNPLKAAKGIGVMERIRAMRTANSQKAVGAKVGKSQGPSIIERITSLRETVSQKISDARAQRIQKRLEATQKRLEESIPRDENGLIDDIPDLSEEELAAINSSTLVQTGVAVHIMDTAQEQSEQQIPVQPNPVQEQPTQPNPVQEQPTQPNPVTLDPEQSNSEQTTSTIEPGGKQESTNPVQTLEPKAKKTMSRSKSIQASKKAAREAGKMKNSYQERIKAKAQAKAIAEQRIAEAAKIKEAEEAKKKEAEALAEQARIAEEQEEKKRQAELLAAREKAIVAEKAKQEQKLIPRFTRQLKSIEESIKNKKYIPNMTKKQRNIAGVLTAASLVLAIGIGVAASNASAEDLGKAPTQPTTPVVETVESTRTELGEVEQLVYKESYGQEQSIKTNNAGDVQQEYTQNNDGAVEEKSEEDNEKEYLSSIKVGCTMKIDSGKYFASPDGTGAFGNFENYQDGVKELTIIDVITNEGYKTITDSNVSLYDLKQQYPDAKFSYHFVCRHADGRTTTLGWYTENSVEQDLEIENQQLEDDGR